MDVISILSISVGSSTVQLHASLGNRRAWACSETGFSSQNGNRTWGVYHQTAAFCCAFSVGKRARCKGYCDMWAISMKWVSKHVATDRLILGNHLITEHSFHGYKNWKLWTLRNQTVASELTHSFQDNAFTKNSNGTLGGSDLYLVLWQLWKGVHSWIQLVRNSFIRELRMQFNSWVLSCEVERQH
jgi:hypothetical protein